MFIRVPYYTGTYIHIGVGISVVRSTEMGNARASESGTDNKDSSTSFLCPIRQRLLADIRRFADMSALLNANTAEENFYSSGFTPTAIPEAKSSQTGVSVEYAPDPHRRWYLLRATYSREHLAADLLISQGIYAYVPQRYEMTLVNGRRRKLLKSLLPSLVFAYLTPGEAILYVKGNLGEEKSPIPRLSTFLTFYYNHFQIAEDYRNPPLIIPPAEMENFILATSTHDENLMVLSEGDFRYKSDTEVRIVAGEFQGVKGRVIRAKGQQRVLVRLSGVCLCATAYIPTAFLRELG